MGSKIVAIIPARYESTRLPGKPLALIDGKVMIQHVYERTRAAALIDTVLVATDDERIARAVREFGGEVAMTRREHPSGTDRIAEVAHELVADVVLNVQGDLPFLQPDMLEKVVGLLEHDSGLPMATVKAPLYDRADVSNPNVVKVVTDRDGYALYFSRSPIPFWRAATDQGVVAYKHIGLYAYRRDFLMTFAGLAPTALERAEQLEQLRALEWGFRIRVAETRGVGVEVDTPQDLEYARAMAAGSTSS